MEEERSKDREEATKFDEDTSVVLNVCEKMTFEFLIVILEPRCSKLLNSFMF